MVLLACALACLTTLTAVLALETGKAGGLCDGGAGAMEQPIDAEPASWVRSGRPVPPSVLYSEGSPAPPVEAKARSWHNRILFPAVQCPYCGRRVPTRQGSYAFLLLGFAGQIFFSIRFLIQWLASERVGVSVIPAAFWWLSILASALVLAYALSIKALPIVLGQLPGFLVYARNLYLASRSSCRGGRPG